MAPNQGDDMRPIADPDEAQTSVTASERFLRSLRREGVDYVFANLGTDHTPILEAAARIRAAGKEETIPSFVICPHEFTAMSAAHGYAAATGNPQAVLVHVDVGTQNLGAAFHNAHRANTPVFVMAGLAPVTDVGYPGSRSHPVHYFQDVFDQSGIVREYCRWTQEYRPPADPADIVVRGLERAMADDAGPVYVSVTREALETDVTPENRTVANHPRRVRSAGADAATIEALANRIRNATAPLVITSYLGRPPADERVESLVRFAETAGAGVLEHTPTALCFPRDHELHAGFDPVSAFEHTDLVIIADTDIPWVPADGSPPADTPVVQIDTDPTKRTYPRWRFDIDVTVEADPARTLDMLADRLNEEDGESGRSRWQRVSAARRETTSERLKDDREAGRLTPSVLSDAIADVIDDDTVVVEDAVTSRGSILQHIPISKPGNYLWKGGAGLGWAGGAAVGVKLARPASRVIVLVGDGSYLFAHPTASAWLAAEYDAPTMTIVYDNRGWKAVEGATASEYPDGAAAASGVPESRFETPLDLSAPATAVDAVTNQVHDIDTLTDALAEGVEAVDNGTPAVIDVNVDRE